MNHSVQSEMVTIEEVISNATPGWRLKLEPIGHNEFQTLNARGVEFIAKPGKIQELRNCIRGNVMDYLRLTHGFSSAMVLSSHKEPRLVLVLTFWNTEMQAANNCWENAPTVRKVVQPLIDVCSKVQTYEATVPKSSELQLQEARRKAC
jgi:heme-degrading monooxygenase HmoA